MAKGILFSTQSPKSSKSFIQSVEKNASRFGFGIRQVFDLGKMYRDQGVDIADDFKTYSILLCNFQRSYRSMRSNPERAAVLLEPKQVLVHDSSKGVTVNYLPFPRAFIRDALPQDEPFADGLHESCQKIIELIKACI